MHTPSLQIIPSSYLYKETLFLEFSLHFIHFINLNENDNNFYQSILRDEFQASDLTLTKDII